MNTGIVIALYVLGALLFFGLIIAACYVKASPQVAIILSGVAKNPRLLVGNGGVKIPFFERKDELYLGQIAVDVQTEGIPTSTYINVDVDAVCNVQIGQTKEDRLKASQHFLNKNPESIAEVLEQIIQGNLREIIGKMDLDGLTKKRDELVQNVAESATMDLQKMGLEILSFNIQKITDDKGLIEDLGADNTALIKQTAAINKAKAERNVAVEKARLSKEANDAAVAAELEIAQKQNELAIKKSELKKAEDQKRAEADLQYEITKQERQRELNIASVNAQIAQQERQKELNAAAVEAKTEEIRRNQELTEQAKIVNNNKLDVQVKQVADAEKYRIEQEAAASLEKQKRAAEAARYLAEQDAAAKKAQADAERYVQEQEAAAIKAKGIAEAAAIEATGIADAAAIKAKGVAEAEALELKAEAYKKNQEATLAEKIIESLPQLAEQVAKPMENIKDVRIYGNGSNGGVNSLSGNVATGVQQTLDLAKAVTGLDVVGILSGLGKKSENTNA